MKVILVDTNVQGERANYYTDLANEICIDSGVRVYITDQNGKVLKVIGEKMW